MVLFGETGWTVCYINLVWRRNSEISGNFREEITDSHLELYVLIIYTTFKKAMKKKMSFMVSNTFIQI